MNNQEAKIAVLEKIFYDFIPKINQDKIFFDGEGIHKNIMQCTITEDNRADCYLTIYANYDETTLLGIEFYNSNSNLDYEFTAIKEAINKMSFLLSLTNIVKLAQNTKHTLDEINNISNCRIGGLKNILGYSQEIDMSNLETRKVLIEKTTLT